MGRRGAGAQGGTLTQVSDFAHGARWHVRCKGPAATFETNPSRRILVKKKLLASVLLGVSLVTLGAVASATEPLPTNGSTTLETVDSVTVVAASGSLPTLFIEGVVAGESQPREFSIHFPSDATIQENCVKLAVLSQTHPGRYNLVLSVNPRRSCQLKSR
jgi:hypothetical protein